MMQNQEECGGGAMSCEFEDWGSFGDEAIIQQKSVILADKSQKIPFEQISWVNSDELEAKSVYISDDVNVDDGMNVDDGVNVEDGVNVDGGVSSSSGSLHWRKFTKSCLQWKIM
ncbi:hypothetical protein LWI28_013827 [Acer negundo]|uniref:Uncharacterized protein n=1 Tax=Acer negundo TaxID=4023 RepID=A0AAD5IZ89_ACENE|nr:hypothetical protein LWI28_013827 [Acer negundo]